MLFEDTYKTIEKPSEGIFRDRASKFIALAFPASSESDVKSILADLRKKYWDSNHHCYAYQLGLDKSAWRVNDDGEPSGTAGRPIFGQIQSKDLTNVLIVVVRYFGGTKLGVSGLINAYKTVAREALDNAVIIERTINDVYEVKFGYEHMNDVMKILKDENLPQGSHKFEESCSLIFKVRQRDSQRIHDMFLKLKNIEIKCTGTE
jgi:uncharacterized YigZ family protein